MRWRQGRRSSNIEDRRGQRVPRRARTGGIGVVGDSENLRSLDTPAITHEHDVSRRRDNKIGGLVGAFVSECPRPREGATLVEPQDKEVIVAAAAPTSVGG